MNQKSITAFTRDVTAQIHREAEALLKPLAEKYGLQIKAAGGNHDGTVATLKFAFRLTSEEAERAAFAESCRLFNCNPSDYGRVATFSGKEWTLVGFELSRRAYPIRCRDTDGKVMLFKEDVLRTRFHTNWLEVAKSICHDPFQEVRPPTNAP